MKSFKQETSHKIIAAAFLLLALSLWCPAEVTAQWMSGGGNTTTADKVGVGTSSTTPAAQLEVKKDQAGGTEVRVSNTATTGGFAGVYLNGGFSLGSGGFLQWNNNPPPYQNLFVATGSNVPLYLGTNNSIRMAVDGSTGNVGVGTTAPANALHVHSDFSSGYMRVSGAGLGAINFQDKNAAPDKQIYQWRSEGGVFRMSLSNDAGTELMRQNILVSDSSGNIGVGTGAPVAKFDVRQVGNSGANATLMLSQGANEDTYLRGGSGAAIIHIGDMTATTSKLLLMENGGSVGVGTSTPDAQYKLDTAARATPTTETDGG